MGERIFYAKAIYMLDNNFEIVFVNHEKYFDQAKADCALLGAAPDLLAALESIVEMNPPLPMGMIEAAEQAIAKAKGEKA